MRRHVKQIVATLSMMMIISGCGIEEKRDAEWKQQEEGKPKKLVIWEEKGKGAALKPAIKSFEEKYNINVEYKELELSAEMKEKIRLDGPAGTGPDVLSLPHDQIGQLALEGVIVPIEVKEETVDTFTDQAIEAQMYDGKLYGLPKAIETPIFIYNKALMSKPPETMEELYAFSKEKRNKEEYGFLAPWDNFYFANAVLSGMGGYVFSQDGGKADPMNIGLHNDASIRGATYIQKWYEEKLFPKGIIGENGGSTLEGLFSEGKVASVMSGPWAFESYQSAGIDIGASAMPLLPNGNPMNTFIGVKGFHVNSFSPYQKWSTKLVEHLTNEQNAKIRYEQTEEVPPVNNLLDDPMIKENEKASAIVEQAKTGEPMPNIPEMTEIWGPMVTAMQLVANGKEEPKQALEEAVRTIKSQIEANHGS
ncbi:extracellular solute-binding protein [Bacillus sp. CGMCC 1.16541]|uniref:extracellular solute-binding protein n=1 Tax=Bacillus sp. CGMCC 1.16541 TaxID=2185143 RepID=UPI001EF513D2|nr:extracellular solute-binding protein [Bacillus sp. CGMCC 1.16541]